MLRYSWFLLQLTILLLVAGVAFSEQPFVTSPELPSYKPSSIEKSELNSIGSDSMEGLMSLWTSRYIALQPDANIKNFGRGSAAAPAALIDGSADLGPMARPMKSPEQDAFLKEYGFEPTSVTTSFAAVAIYVSKDNPLQEISLEELDAIFAKKPSRAASSINVWRELNVEGSIGQKRIVKVGLTPNHPLSLYFRQQALLQSDFATELTQRASREAFFSSIAADDSAIGFAEAIKESAGVKALAVRVKKGLPAVFPSYENITSGKYPLSRALSLYLVRSPEEPVEEGISDFLTFVLSSEGQRIVESQGFVPVNAEIREQELAKLK